MTSAWLALLLVFQQAPSGQPYRIDVENMWRAERDLQKLWPHLDDPSAQKALAEAFLTTKVRTIAIDIAKGTALHGSLAVVSQWPKPMEAWRLSELVLSLEHLKHPRRLELVERFCRDRRGFVRAAAYRGFLASSEELERLYELVKAERDPAAKKSGVLVYGLKRFVASQKGIKPLPPKFAR